MKLPRRRFWLAAIVLLPIVAGAIVWRVGGALVAPANHVVGVPPADLKIESLTIGSASGSQLAAWLMPAENASATVVLLHGIRANRRTMLGRAKLFHAAGYDVLMIDLQAHGESPGKQITIGYLERFDAAAAVNYARQRNPQHKIAVVGCSLGGAAAVLASPLKIDALVLESVFPTIEEAVYDRLAVRLGPLAHVVAPLLLWQIQPRLGFSPSELRPIDHIGAVGCLVLVAAGEIDPHTKLDESRRLFAAAVEPKQWVEFPGAGHVDLQANNPALYRQSVLPFLQQHLATSTAGDER